MSRPYAGVVTHYNSRITVARPGRPSRTYRASRASRSRIERLVYYQNGRWDPHFSEQHHMAGYKALLFKEE